MAMKGSLRVRHQMALDAAITTRGLNPECAAWFGEILKRQGANPIRVDRIMSRAVYRFHHRTRWGAKRPRARNLEQRQAALEQP